MRIAFEGLAATVEAPDCPEFLTAMKSAAIGWPFHAVETGAEPIARVTKSRRYYRIHVPGEEPMSATAVGAACSLMVSLAEAFVIENPSRLCLHGGAALLADRLVVFPGRSHTGKSTLIARLAAGGHGIFCDDILPLDGADGVAMGAAPRLRLPLPARVSRAFRNFVARHAGASDGVYQYLSLPDGGLARHGATAPLGAIVLLDRHRSGPATMHEAPRSLALKLLARQNVSRNDDARPLLAQMHAIVQRLPCYVMSYSDLEEATALLEAAFARWPACPRLSPPIDPAALSDRMLERDDAGADDGPEDAAPGYRPGMRLVRNPGISLHDVDGEAFLAGSDATAAIQHLNPVGAGIWSLLARPTDEGEAVHALAVAFPDVDPQVITRDVASLFLDLHRSGFAVEAPETAGRASDESRV